MARRLASMRKSCPRFEPQQPLARRLGLERLFESARLQLGQLTEVKRRFGVVFRNSEQRRGHCPRYAMLDER